MKAEFKILYHACKTFKAYFLKHDIKSNFHDWCLCNPIVYIDRREVISLLTFKGTII